MKFFLKVLVLVGLIIVGKWEKEYSLLAAKQAEHISSQAYSSNSVANFASKQSEQKIKTISVHLN